MLIAQDGPLAITEPVIMPVIMEVLAGAREDRRERDLCDLIRVAGVMDSSIDPPTSG